MTDGHVLKFMPAILKYLLKNWTQNYINEKSFYFILLLLKRFRD